MPLSRATLSPGSATHPAMVATNDIRDIRPPVPLPDVWSWLPWLLAAVVLAAGAFLLWRHRRRRALSTPPAPSEPPHLRARRRLQEALALLDDPRAFCFAVSDALRGYLEERFALHAPERTTEEFLLELQYSAVLAPDQKTTLADFLQQCDLVKFARFEPGQAQLRQLHAVALRLVEETEPVEPVASAGAPPHSGNGRSGARSAVGAGAAAELP